MTAHSYIFKHLMTMSPTVAQSKRISTDPAEWAAFILKTQDNEVLVVFPLGNLHLVNLTGDRIFYFVFVVLVYRLKFLTLYCLNTKKKLYFVQTATSFFFQNIFINFYNTVITLLHETSICILKLIFFFKLILKSSSNNTIVSRAQWHHPNIFI